MKTIAVLNYKGGVGKTTFTISASQALALAGYRVLAIDNDGQHNLSLLIGDKDYRPNIRDVYHSSLGNAGKYFMQSIRETGIANLHIITSPSELGSYDVKDPFILQKTFLFCSLSRFYDFVLIDNSPGIDLLQEAAIHAADEIFIPTELSFFAASGIKELSSLLQSKFHNECPISKIIPNFYKNTKRQNQYLETLKNEFSGKVTNTLIPFDTMFDDCMREGKTLFIHRLYTKAAANYLRLVEELFGLDEEKTWEIVMEKRKFKLSSEARKRFMEKHSGFQSYNQNEHDRLKTIDLKPRSPLESNSTEELPLSVLMGS
jgi:chromosome partitioning protein